MFYNFLNNFLIRSNYYIKVKIGHVWLFCSYNKDTFFSCLLESWLLPYNLQFVAMAQKFNKTECLCCVCRQSISQFRNIALL